MQRIEWEKRKRRLSRGGSNKVLAQVFQGLKSVHQLLVDLGEGTLFLASLYIGDLGRELTKQS